MIDTEVKPFRFNRTNLDLSAIPFPALSQPGRLFVYTNASYYIKFTGSLSWNTSFCGNWETQPPENLPGSDCGTTSGLSWTFGTSLRIRPRRFNSQSRRESDKTHAKSGSLSHRAKRLHRIRNCPVGSMLEALQRPRLSQSEKISAPKGASIWVPFGPGSP